MAVGVWEVEVGVGGGGGRRWEVDGGKWEVEGGEGGEGEWEAKGEG